MEGIWEGDGDGIRVGGGVATVGVGVVGNFVGLGVGIEDGIELGDGLGI